MSSHGGGRGKRVCILGATGGVGSIAVQIAKAEDAEVNTSFFPVIFYSFYRYHRLLQHVQMMQCHKLKLWELLTL